MQASFVRRWDQFWFGEISGYPLTMYRIGVGLMILLIWLSYARDFVSLFGPHAILLLSPAEAEGQGRLSILNWLPRTEFVGWGLYSLIVVGALGLVTGVFARISAFLAWVGMQSFYGLSVLSIYSGESLLVISTFFLIFVDARFARAKTISAWPLRMLQVNFSLVWVVASIQKMLQPFWRNGEAVFYALQLAERRGAMPIFLLQNPFSIRLMTWGTIAGEMAIGLLLWVPRWRRRALWAALLFHCVLAVSSRIYAFQMIMCMGLILFLSESEFRAVFSFKVLTEARP